MNKFLLTLLIGEAMVSYSAFAMDGSPDLNAAAPRGVVRKPFLSEACKERLTQRLQSDAYLKSFTTMSDAYWDSTSTEIKCFALMEAFETGKAIIVPVSAYHEHPNHPPRHLMVTEMEYTSCHPSCKMIGPDDKAWVRWNSGSFTAGYDHAWKSELTPGEDHNLHFSARLYFVSDLQEEAAPAELQPVETPAAAAE